ncbi:MAG: GIY-YIG nuclease family protein [Gammaproteobacteria bacterium]|nr:GIY-YIG nuclease family protein [Gammaproteobacteria bacterium]
MYITYKITNLVNNKYYIGKTSLRRWNRGYMGSGKLIRKAVAKYGKNSFIRTILSSHESEIDAFNFEESLLTPDVVNDSLCYNITLGGLGASSGQYNHCSGRTGDKHPMYNKKRPDTTLSNRNRKGMTYNTSDKPNSSTGKKRPNQSAKLLGRKRPQHSKYMTGDNNPNSNKSKLIRLKDQMKLLDNPVKQALLDIPID